MIIPDSEQRAKALHPTKSFIVQSPAGSGKTELLIQRYLTLLSTVNQPEAIVAITFTRKAAGEMLRRITNALTNSTGPRPDKPHEALTWDLACKVREQSKTYGWRLLENPGRLRIQTIDSLCASITRQMPWLSRMGGPPNIVEDGEELYIEAARSAIELVEEDKWFVEVGSLLTHVDNNFQVLENLIAGMLARRDQWLRHIVSVDPENNRASLELALRNVILDAVARTREAIPEERIAEIVAVTAAAGSNLSTDKREGPASACINQTELPDADHLEAWLGIADILLTKEGNWRKALTVRNGFPTSDKPLKQRGSQLISDLAENELLRLSIDELRYLPDQHFSDSQWQVLSAMVKLLPAAVEKLEAFFRERGVADYVEVAMAARRSLGGPDNPTDLALCIDCQIQHILIDEFQDTSISQYSLLEALTVGWKSGDGRTIFAVGDPMQSIYRFREAEVGLFLKTCREGIGKIPMDQLRLSANFRSDKGIVDWVNNSFPGILPSEEDITTGAIPFRASDSIKDLILDPAVTIHPFIGRNDEAEAAQVVKTVQSAQADHSKVAILVRARSHLTQVLPALRAAGLRFRAVEIESLAQVPVVQDLTALTRSLIHPADRIAWLAILRAPWCGMTLEELHALVGANLKSAIWDLMRDESIVQKLNPEGRKRLLRIRSVLETALRKRPASLRLWIEGVWLSLGGPACAANMTEMENAKAFFDLLEEMDEGGMLDLAAFKQRIQELYAHPDSEADESLQIMSIHKAKGLEFDVVIVPGLGREPRSEEARLMLWLERPRLGENINLLLAPIHATGADRDKTYDYLKRVDGFKSEHESGRLLYVAATRAKSALHLLGHTEYRIKDDSPELKDPASGSLLKHMWGAVKPIFQTALSALQPSPAVEPSIMERVPQAIQRLSLDWKMPVLPESVHGAEKSSSSDSEESAVSFHWVGDMLRHIGTVVHQVLKHIADDGISEWNEDRLRKHRQAYLSALSGLGVPAAELQEAANRVEAALSRALTDDRGKWLLGPHSNSACEYSICGILEEQIVSARIDRTFVDDQDTRWVIDYKSSLHEGGGVEEFLDNECSRYREQLMRYRSLFGLMENRPIRTALYFPLLNAWREVE
ncbi:MAG: UvrD-helicase domain-containing protein [Acidobacteria bacterium]|nr:UvrD-helicase domain-containing protein [Acidobacteriota bacterium]